MISRRARCIRLAGVLAWLAVAGVSRALANQDDVSVPVASPDLLLTDQTGWLTATAGAADLAVYPEQGTGHHRWHGRVRGDVAIAQPTIDSVVRLGLSVQTVADDRNDIYFRLTRVYYDAFTAYERRFGIGVAYAGYRHRCSHGADAAVDGRVLIRSGPEIGYRLEYVIDAFTIAGHAFAHTSLIAQNPDERAMPRALFGAAGEVRWRTDWVSWLIGAGLGTAVVGSWDDYTASLTDEWRELYIEPLPAATLGAVLHGERADFRVLAHYQRILDSGFGERADPTHVFSLQLGFVY